MFLAHRSPPKKLNLAPSLLHRSLNGEPGILPRRQLSSCRVAPYWLVLEFYTDGIRMALFPMAISCGCIFSGSGTSNYNLDSKIFNMPTEKKNNPIVNNKKFKIPVIVGLGVCALLVGAAMPTVKWTGFGQHKIETLKTESAESAVLKLALWSPSARAQELQTLAETGHPLDRSRAKYLLAVDLMQLGQGEAALKHLDGLEKSYPILAPYILKQRATAYEMIGNSQQAEKTWQTLVKDYANSTVAAEGLYKLGQTNPEYWQQAIAQFPSHPRTVEIATQLLKQPSSRSPELDKTLRLLIAQYGLHLPDIVNYLDQLTSKYAKVLTPQEWEVIGFAYW